MLVTQEQRHFTRQMHLVSPMIKSGDVIRILKISRQRLEIYRKKQLLECIKVGGQWRYFLHSLQWLKRNYLTLTPKEKAKCNYYELQYKMKVDKINNLPIEGKFNIPVKDLPLSTRLKRCFTNNHLFTLKDIVEKTESEHLITPNFGHKALNELINFLNDINLKLETKFNDCIITNGLSNVYRVHLTKTRGIFDSIDINILADDDITLYRKLSSLLKDKNIEYDIVCLGRAVNIDEAQMRINDWL